tara:strand:- start:60 stop:272 length:213 start_codon:yes stop_codon:yes gene_type:complete
MYAFIKDALCAGWRLSVDKYGTYRKCLDRLIYKNTFLYGGLLERAAYWRGRHISSLDALIKDIFTHNFRL